MRSPLTSMTTSSPVLTSARRSNSAVPLMRTSRVCPWVTNAMLGRRTLSARAPLQPGGLSTPVVVSATNAGQTGTVGGAAGELESRPRLWHALRADPRHAAELCVLHAFPLLSPHAQQWWQAQHRRRPDDPPDV